MAAWYGLRHAGHRVLYQSGRDPAYDSSNVGFVLLCHTIRAAFDDAVREYRFGLGDEAYKSRFAEHDHGLDTVAIPAVGVGDSRWGRCGCCCAGGTAYARSFDGPNRRSAGGIGIFSAGYAQGLRGAP